jgi:hypothetical protein
MKSTLALAVVLLSTTALAGTHYDKKVKQTKTTTTTEEQPQAEEDAEYTDTQEVRTKKVRTKSHGADGKKSRPRNAR